MLFSQIIGQKTIKERLIRTVHENRIPHAQLFRGREGVGKLALAVAYGQYICCKTELNMMLVVFVLLVLNIQN